MNRHFVYGGRDDEFLAHYAPLFQSLGQQGPTATEVLEEVKKQRQHRMQQPEETAKRAQLISEQYTRLHPDVYVVDRKRFLAPEFEELIDKLGGCSSRPTEIQACAEELKSRGVLKEIRPGLWTFRVLTKEFCELLEDELAHFRKSGLPCARPNTMNRKGIILGELGFKERLFNPLVEDLSKVAAKFFPFRTEELDSYRVFTVLYDFAEDGDRELAQHYDNAEVTLNINIGGEWDGGQVRFFGDADAERDPSLEVGVGLELGHGVLHAGIELHQAEPITAGRRHNLIFWCRSSEVRNDRCPMCFERPEVVATNTHMHEGFTCPPLVPSTL